MEQIYQSVSVSVKHQQKKERLSSFLSFEPAEGFGPPTPRLQITCSTAELRRQPLVAFASAKVQKLFTLTTFF